MFLNMGAILHAPICRDVQRSKRLWPPGPWSPRGTEAGSRRKQNVDMCVCTIGTKSGMMGCRFVDFVVVYEKRFHFRAVACMFHWAPAKLGANFVKC